MSFYIFPSRLFSVMLSPLTFVREMPLMLDAKLAVNRRELQRRPVGDFDAILAEFFEVVAAMDAQLAVMADEVESLRDDLATAQRWLRSLGAGPVLDTQRRPWELQTVAAGAPQEQE
jgi:hypothetical protein